MQSKKLSLIEQMTRTTINYILSLLSYPIFFPDVKISRSMMIALYFLTMSLVNGYIIRRMFERFTKAKVTP
jgi:hypothetical protein